jgi:hypothetical protein
MVTFLRGSVSVMRPVAALRSKGKPPYCGVFRTSTEAMSFEEAPMPDLGDMMKHMAADCREGSSP